MTAETPYGIGTRLPGVPYEEAVNWATEGLKEEGFGVLTEIDVQETLKRKLNAEFRRYVILGACNPPLAYRALGAELHLGLLLPCNVIVYEDGADSQVWTIAPLVALGIVDNPELAGVAREVDVKLQRVIDGLRARAAGREVDPQADGIRRLLEDSKTIAVVGLSQDPDRPSHRVARYLQAEGYRIVPVHPGGGEILGEQVYPSLEEIPFPVDVVDVFRRPEHALAVAESAVRVGAGALWLQEGVINEQAAAVARDAGLEVVMDRCMLKEHERWRSGDSA